VTAVSRASGFSFPSQRLFLVDEHLDAQDNQAERLAVRHPFG
jgi:hypothetical protein